MRNLKRVLALAMAMIMVIGMMVVGASAASTTEYDYSEAQAIVTGTGIFEGDDAGEMNWEGTLTREMAAKIMAYIMLGEETAEKLVSKTQNFSDVAVTRWSAKYIEYCVNTGLIAGRGDGTFDPEGKLTGIAFAKLLLVAQGYDADAEGYVSDNWSTAIAVDAMTEGLDLDEVTLYDVINRQQAAQMILQILENDMVYYETIFDKATATEMLVGPYPDDDTFGEYHLGVFCDYGGYEMWGRPVDHTWYDAAGNVLYYLAKTPVKTYTTAVAECDIYEDLGLKKDADITKATLNNVSVSVNNDEINALATRVKIGAQGRLTEIYRSKTGYEIVMIDTFLAVVEDTTECTYDRNGHLDEQATMTLTVYTDEDGVEYTLSAKKDYEYEAGEWLLVYVNEKENKKKDEPDVVVVDYAESLEGAQTAYTTVETHEVEDKEYDDAHTFYLDEAGNETSDHEWFFDLYGNLIGVIDLPVAPATYGVISSIYWKDSRDGETGYAWAKITYMDGEFEWAKVAKINGLTLEGVEGKHADYAEGLVSSTKQYNEYGVSADSDYTNVALYKISNTKAGLALTEVDSIEGQLTTNKKTLVEDEAYANSKTMFLVWNSKKETYSAYVGIKNLPNYKNAEIEMWAANIENDTNAEYVFVIDPKTKGAKDDVDNVLYYANNVTIRTAVEDDVIVSFTIRGGSIASIVVPADGTEVDYTDNALVNDILTLIEGDGIMALEITNGYVTEVIEIDPDATLDDDLTVAYAGELGEDCEYEPDDETLFVDGEWYDVMDAELVGAASWKAAERAGKNVYIVYDEDLVATLVYFA